MIRAVKKILPYFEAIVFTVFVIWTTLMMYETVTHYFSPKPVSYNDSKINLILKAPPEDVIHSQAKKLSGGNTEIEYAYVTGEVPADTGEDITRRTPVSQTKVLEQYKEPSGRPMEKLHTTFMSKPQFYKKEGKWRQIEYATTTPEVFSASGAQKFVERREFWERLLPGEPAFALSSTFYPNENPETVSVDGYVGNVYIGGSYSSTDWTSLISGTVSSAYGTSSNATSTTVQSYASFFSCGSYCGSFEDLYISRSFFLFDTSSLTSAATISSATFSVYTISKDDLDNDGDDTLNLITTNPASNTDLVPGDYTLVGATLQASAIDITGITTSAYTGFTLNGTGLGNISKTGITKFGLREGHDLGNTIIANNAYDDVVLSTAEVSGTSQDPKLDVTYTLPSKFSFGQWFPF